MDRPDDSTNDNLQQESHNSDDKILQQPRLANEAVFRRISSVNTNQHGENDVSVDGSHWKASLLDHTAVTSTQISEDISHREVALTASDEHPPPEVGAVTNNRESQTVLLNGHAGLERWDDQLQSFQQINVNGQTELRPGEIEGPGLPEVIPTLWEAFVESVAKYPTHLAIASIYQKGEVRGHPNLELDNDAYRASPYLRWSYLEFAKAILRTIQAFEAQQITQGCLVFTFCTNSAEFVTILWAAMALGCTVVPIHARTLLNRQEAIHIINTAKATVKIDRTIVFAQTSDIARQIVDLNIMSTDQVVVMEEHSSDLWRSFTSFLPAPVVDADLNLVQYNETTKCWALIVYTSGTTALPKGVVLNSYRIDRIIAIRREAAPVAPGESCFLPLPNNHIFFHFFGLLAPGVGGGIVLPSPTFQPQHAPDIMEMEQCAHFPMSPTMVHAIKDIVISRGVKFSSLKTIGTGGAKLSIEFVEACLNTIGSRGVEVIYGSTEGCAITSTGVIQSAKDIIRNGDASVGVPRLGCTVKICRPGETKPLPRNTEGDLHYATATLCDGYAGGDKPETFYTDEQGRNWFATGDAATINDEGMVFIVGRLKDMIIRGGVNIAPASMEFVLAKNSATAPFNVQVVGKLDPIAGEVPIGVSTKPVTLDGVEMIQNTVSEQMGPIYEPEEILTLEQLGLEDFPRTLLGKVQKNKLTEIVRKFINERDTPSTDHVEVDDLAEKVQKVWTRTIGHGVKADTELSSFADSITIMRVRDRFKKDLGADISLGEMLGLRTVNDQIEIIKKRSGRKVAKQTPIKVVSTGGPKIDEMLHLALKSQWFSSTQAWINDKIAKYDFQWDDIQEITPASDFTSALTQADVQNTSWSWKFAFLAREGISKDMLRKGVEVMLANNPILTSFLFTNKTAFGSDVSLHVMPKPTPKLFNAVFRDHGTIGTREDFANEVYKPYEYQMAMVPDDILINFLLFDVEDCNRAGTIMVANHAIVDASYLQLLLDDFDKALGGGEGLEPHISYKTWADSYYSLRTSLEAQVMVAWQVQRLDDLAAHKRSVFPAAFDPHSPAVRTHTQDVSDNGYHIDFHIPGLTNLRSKHLLLSAPTVVKAAWSLLNIHRNKTNTALFSNLQADRRRFPFVPKALELLSPAHTFEASTVAGPTLQDVVNIIHLYPEETVLGFMLRVASDQEELNKYAAAPLKTIFKEIGPINAEIMIDVLRSQIFNWTPGLGALQTHNPNENYEPMSSFIRPKLRLVINVDVGGADDETCFAQIKSPMFDKEGLKSMADDLQGFLTWLCDESNWDRRVGDFKSALRGEEGGNVVNGDGEKKEHYL